MKHHVVDLAELGDERLSLQGSIEPGEIDFSRDDVRQLEPVDWSGFLERIGDEVRLAGSLETRLELACVRCLDPIDTPVRRRFDLFFMERDSLVYDEDDEIELEERDTRVAFVVGTELPMDDIMHEQIVLTLPMKPLCRSDCRGLCPTCGANRNQQDCGCAAEKINPAFEQLLELRKRLEDGNS